MKILILLCVMMTVSAAVAAAPPANEKYLETADQIEKTLWEELNRFFPACIDEQHGGYRAWFSDTWKLQDTNYKTIVYQARMTWITSQIVLRRPSHADQYRVYAQHGLKFLNDTMWDKEQGGFFWGLSETGKIDPRYTDEKHAYGIAFGIYGAAAAGEALNDPAGAELALKAFKWLDEHAHDATNGGYFEALARDGKPIMAPRDRSDPRNRFDKIGTLYGYKSMNTHIHLLEAVTQLSRVSKDPLVKERLAELHSIVRDKIYVKPGCLNQYFTPAWQPLPDGDSFGHDIETAFLLFESAEALGLHHDPATMEAAKSLVDHALEYGFDKDRGGFYDEGPAFKEPFKTQKIWWAQAEGLNALLLMHQEFGTDTQKYYRAFDKQWGFISKYQLDPVNGGWFWEVTAAGKHKDGESKANEWKAAYHTGRAMLNTSEMLRKLAGAEPPK